MAEWIETDDGSLTLRHAVLGELYHSDRGAVGEAEHVYLRAGLDAVVATTGRRQVAVFEVGFGTGLNAWLTARRAQESRLQIDYHAIDLYQLDDETLRGMDYTDDSRVVRRHAGLWDGIAHEWTEGVSLTKYAADLTTFDFTRLAERFDLVYFDAFAPDAQPELWSEEIMGGMFTLLRPGGVLVTYSAKGTVKQALRAAGFEVTRLPGALGKRHMVRAVRPME